MESNQQTSNWAEMEMPSDDEEGHQHHPHPPNPEDHKEGTNVQQTAEGGQISIARTNTTKRKPQLTSKNIIFFSFFMNWRVLKKKKGRK